MKKIITIITITGVFVLLNLFGSASGNSCQPAGSNSEQTGSQSAQTKTTSVQTKSKSAQTKSKAGQTGSKSTQTKSKSVQTGSKATQTKSKTVQKSPPADKTKDSGTITIGTQKWALANLNVITFRNGDTIPEARSNAEWTKAGDAGKPAWCYYNNNPAFGPKYGRLYNWYALNDPRGLAPAGWSLASDTDWTELGHYLARQGDVGNRLKSTTGWSEGSEGTNESGFSGLPGGYRVENGTFQNSGSIGVWWSSTESKTLEAIDHYLSESNILARSSTPKQRGESVRCLRK